MMSPSRCPVPPGFMQVDGRKFEIAELEAAFEGPS